MKEIIETEENTENTKEETGTADYIRENISKAYPEIAEELLSPLPFAVEVEYPSRGGRNILTPNNF